MNNNEILPCDHCGEDGTPDEITKIVTCEACDDAAFERWANNGENWFPTKQPCPLPDNRWH